MIRETRTKKKRFSSKFPDGYADRQAPDEVRRAQRPKCCENNKNEVNSLHVNNENS